jgi:hypothetical protein
MAILPAQLLAPEGPITPLLFPGEGVNELSARLQAYLDNAALRAEVVAAPAPAQDGLINAYALYTAFTDVYIRMSAQPLTITVTEKGGHGYSAEQIRNMKALATKYWDDFVSLQEVTVPLTSPGISPGTRSVATDVRW